MIMHFVNENLRFNCMWQKNDVIEKKSLYWEALNSILKLIFEIVHSLFVES